MYLESLINSINFPVLSTLFIKILICPGKLSRLSRNGSEAHSQLRGSRDSYFGKSFASSCSIYFEFSADVSMEKLTFQTDAIGKIASNGRGHLYLIECLFSRPTLRAVVSPADATLRTFVA